MHLLNPHTCIQDWPANKLLLLCEDAYIASHPDEPNPTFANSDKYREVVLVSGEVCCLNTRERLVAPVVVPRKMRCVLTAILIKA